MFIFDRKIKETLNHKIHTFNLSKFKNHSAMRNEFVIMPMNEFTETLNSDSHFKNKFYTVFLFKEAAGTIIIDSQEFELQSQKFFFINYNQVYHLKNDRSCTGDVLLFTKSFYNYIYTGNKMIKSDTALHNVSPFIVLKEENMQDLAQIFNELRKEYLSHKLLRKEIVCLLLKVFMLKYIRNSNKKNKINTSITHKKDIVNNFSNLVNQHYKELKTTSKYAEKLHLTPNYLNALVKESLDITAGQFIKNRIILEAERLLLHTTLSITEISYELGFNDNSHFGKYFKSVKKTSPNTYRLMQNTDE
ncbi:HTH-type transcriptional activator RhaS [Chryseobacterium aquaeductus]|uniref:HTH-type transcriptional activator RhaS n=1 Tax=Chryseobacterium aquaeductus TaxID=2675056 RepID=A0A9N8MPZ8_9FLAO|nr:helix-turn-helix domain-containing protein [Chryseobacterium aquaeductus]CAA7331912.1 HTH-type transcriptional activator RhaS [Chryseobacterium potabilaquae]CAD7813249.1 HTH-type transcriptional activator RhaS [Chryseobacterium aquaeductus]